MSFKVAARTIIQLGAELISSDAIAFYELIKNAFDAKSPRADIDVVVRLPFEKCALHLEAVGSKEGHEAQQRGLEARKAQAVADVDASAPEADRLRECLSRAASWSELKDALERANYIVISDTGSGMSLGDLQDIYLTIGTTSRWAERETQKKQVRKDGASLRPILGEKGIGRLSAMRLGWRLRVETSKRGEDNWNILEVDWRDFSGPSDKLVEDVRLQPVRGAKKDDAKTSGTRIHICALASGWSAEKLRDITRDQFSRLTDPFVPESRYPISLRFNGQGVAVPRFDKLLFENAHAVVRARYSIDTDGPRLAGKINYLMRDREKVFSLGVVDLISMTRATRTELEALGPFGVEFYWFNRRALSAVEGIGDKRAVQKLVNAWSGGLMVFRDAFRVNPYGSPDDDWLDLDRKALASGGYKVNRKQIVGRVSISSLTSPALIDQTNREGLRDCAEKLALISILKHVMEAQFRTFLNKVDEEVQARMPVSFEDLESRVNVESRQVQEGWKLLLRKHPEVAQDSDLARIIQDAIERLRRVMEEAKQLADSYEKGHTQVVHLAGLGLMVEVLAHELNRVTAHALRTLGDSRAHKLSRDVSSTLATLEAQLRTLQKRLRILDPLSTAGRQAKEEFDLISWVEEAISAHDAQFSRHGINCGVTVEPSRPTSGLKVKMVKGMIVQILENLLSNSVYWLKQQRKLVSGFSPRIAVTIDTQATELRLADNGPGIEPSRKEEIFQPFVTTKPPGEGKGLGLYISREIAKYNGAELILSDRATFHANRLDTFVLSLRRVPE